MGSCQSSPDVQQRHTTKATPKTATVPTKPATKATKTPATNATVAPERKVGLHGIKRAPQADSRRTLRKTGTPADFILDMTNGRPLDASDVTSLFKAKRELRMMRRFAKKFLDEQDDDPENNDYAPPCFGDIVEDDIRFVMYDKQDFSTFEKMSYDKSESVRTLISDAMQENELFAQDTPEEIMQITDIFRPQKFVKGQAVITQGNWGSEFYVVESGKLSIEVKIKDEDGDEGGQVNVGFYSAGSAFGELALIFGNPRAATITAMTDCKLWSIERTAYRSVIFQLRYEQHKEKNQFLHSCVVNGRKFSEIFDNSQIEDLNIAMKMDSYDAGDVIMREGELGDTLYIVKSGEVEAYSEADGAGEENGTIEMKMSFGSESLLKNVPSPQTFNAVTRVEVYYLTRQDFEDMVGSFQDALDGSAVTRTIIKSESKRSIRMTVSMETRHQCELDDLEFLKDIRRGAYGKVWLVQSRDSKKQFALEAHSKDYIVKKSKKENVLMQYKIMKELEHPCIVRMHCAMQDSRYLSFLFDLLPGGDLMSYLAKQADTGKKFAEDVTRFYAVSFVLAFEYLHPLMIAHRDVKPENMMLDKRGYGVIMDFSLAKEIDEGQTYTFCGTPDYLAPEIIRGTGHDWAVDYWGLGIFLFEMTHGRSPFYASNKNHARRTRKILKGYEHVHAPSYVSSGLCDLIEKLLNFDQAKRLGRALNGVQALKSHRWFDGFDWKGFHHQKLTAPIQPVIPDHVNTMGGNTQDKSPVKEETHAPESDWSPNLKNLARW